MITTLIIRADDSAAIGSGHAMRCLALAQEWRSRGGRVVFVAAETTPAFCERLAAGDIGSHIIAAEPGTVDDAAQTVALAQSHTATWLVADGYRLGLDWQRAVKASGLRLLVLDDHDFCETFCADLILNQNALPAGRDYRERAPGADQLLGTCYTLLRREFTAWSGWKRQIPAEARKILVTLGGGDTDNVTAKVVAALGRLAGIEAVVVIGAANPHRLALEALAAVQPVSVRIEVNSPRMAELMAWADLAVTAGGSTSWELAFMGLPAVQCVLADNQAGIAAELHRLGVTINLGGHADLAVETIAEAVRALSCDVERRRTMSERGRRLVDGHGAARVAAALGAPLRITLVSDAGSWYDDFIDDLRDALTARGHAVACIHSPAEIPPGDLVFLLSLGRLVSPEVLRRNPHNIVVHGSALPAGRGWSPITWQILAGQNEIPMTLLEAGEGADTGDIYLTDTMHFRGDELVDELRAAQAASTARLCLRFVARYPFIAGEGRVQTGEGSWYSRRRADDSRLDPDKTLREQFNRLRVADADRYPAFFELAGHRYEIRLTKKPVPSPKSSSSS